MLAVKERKRRSRKRLESIPLAIESPRPKMRRTEPPYLEKEIVRRTEDFDSPNGNNATMADFMDSDEDQIRLGEEECVIDRNLQQPGNEDSILDESCTQVKKAAVKIPSWRVLWALLLTNGPRRMTKNQYQSLRTLADTCAQIEPSSWNQEHKLLSSQIQFSSLNVLPHYNTLHKSFKPAIFQALVPKAFNSEVSVDMTKAGARCSHISASSQATTLLRTVLPSEYARADVGSGPVFQAMCSTTLSSCKTHQQIPDAPGISASACIDIWPIISARQWFYGYPQMSSVDCPDASNSTPSNSTPPNFSASNSTPFCETDDIITVTLLGQDALPDTLARSFKASKNRAGYLQVQGAVLHIWTVHSNIRQHCPGFNCGDTKNLSDRDRDIVRHCSFIAYRSPTDCVNAELPEISLEQSEDNDQWDFGERSQPRARQRRKTSGRMAEAVKIRNAALRKQKLQVQNLWRSWKKPLLKPADVVTMLGPSNDLLSDNSTPRLFVVNRFWVENEERSRHAFFLLGGPLAFLQEGLNSGDATFLSSFSEKIGRNMYRYYRDVLSVHIAKPHPGHRGPQKYTPISSLGTLDSGEKYFIYRFVLFWDGFEISKGKSSSGEGFYMMCLNLPLKDRSSPSAVRIISLTPPGVKFEAVFHRIKADIVQGMTDGFLDIDANGETRRIFLDLVGFVGDTPAINAALDVLGHNATACCHVCRFRRGSSTVVGSRYTSRNQYGSITSHGRGFYKHTAIHDSHAKAETCRLMGMKPLDSNSVLPLHDLRAAIVGCKGKIPTTNNGSPILAGDLDPYQSCFIAPDHLLSGHVRDCINLGFKLLPSRDHREACESFMIGLLRDCGLPVQNRLLNYEKKQLFTMSMSELFALALIAELGFLSGIRQVDFSEVSPSPVSKRCMSAIGLVGSCSRLIAALWSLRDAEKDGVHAVMQFDDENGFTTLSRIQKLTAKHLLDLERQCSMDDADVAYMENAAGGRRSAIEKEHASCLISIRTIDKPNVHRLQELAFSTIPMLGHVSRCAELVLEKAHQTLKRAVRDSNNKDVHLSSMESAAFSDWQGRLTMIAKDALKGDEPALRGASGTRINFIHSRSAQRRAHSSSAIFSRSRTLCAR